MKFNKPFRSVETPYRSEALKRLPSSQRTNPSPYIGANYMNKNSLQISTVCNIIMKVKKDF